MASANTVPKEQNEDMPRSFDMEDIGKIQQFFEQSANSTKLKAIGCCCRRGVECQWRPFCCGCGLNC